MKTPKGIMLIAIASVSVSGCWQVPQAELTRYKQAFSQVQEVSERVLLDYDQAIKESRSFVQARSPDAAPASPYPLTWKDVALELAGEKVDDIQVRRLAFKVVGEYNAVLTQLAEGRSIEQVRSCATGLLATIDQLRTTICGAGIPGLSSVVDIVSTLAELVEKARVRKEFVEAVTKGAPVVEKMIDVMIEDIALHYNLRGTVLNRERTRTVAVVRVVQMTISEIVAQRNVAASDINDIGSELNDQLATVRTEIKVYPIAMTSGGPKAAEYSPIDAAQVQSELGELVRLSDQYKRNIRAAGAVMGMLREYRQMLAETKDAIRALAKSLSAPADLTGAANEMLDAAFRLKRDMEDFRAARALP